MVEHSAWPEDWRKRGEELRRVHESVAWDVGDWINAIDLAHGDVRTIATTFGFDEGTLRNRKSVAARIPISRRRETLSWSHHEAVAGLDETDAERLMAEAELYNWPVTRMREEAQAASTAARLRQLEHENATLKAAHDPPDASEYRDVIVRTERRLKSAAAQLKSIYAEIADILSDPDLIAATSALHGNAARALGPRFEKIINTEANRASPQIERIEQVIAQLGGEVKCHDAGISDGLTIPADPPPEALVGGASG